MVVVKIASQVLRDLAIDDSVDGVVHEKDLVVCADVVSPVGICCAQAALFIEHPCLVRVRGRGEDRWSVRLLRFVVPLLKAVIGELLNLALGVIVILELTGDNQLDLRVCLQTLSGLKEFGLRCGNGLRTGDFDVKLAGDIFAIAENLGFRCIREVDILCCTRPVIGNGVGLEVVNESLADVSIDDCRDSRTRCKGLLIDTFLVGVLGIFCLQCTLFIKHPHLVRLRGDFACLARVAVKAQHCAVITDLRVIRHIIVLTSGQNVGRHNKSVVADLLALGINGCVDDRLATLRTINGDLRTDCLAVGSENLDLGDIVL